MATEYKPSTITITLDVSNMTLIDAEKLWLNLKINIDDMAKPKNAKVVIDSVQKIDCNAGRGGAICIDKITPTTEQIQRIINDVTPQRRKPKDAYRGCSGGNVMSYGVTDWNIVSLSCYEEEIWK